MSFRDQFMQNAAEESSRPPVPSKDTMLRGNQNTLSSRAYHEASSTQPFSPLDADFSNQRQHNTPYGYRYYESGNSVNTFGEQHEMARFPSSSNPFEEAKDPFSSRSGSHEYHVTGSHDDVENESITEKVRKNDRARRKLEKRLPRFHYTKLPYFTILVTLIQVIVFIVELVKMAQLTGSAFQTSPYFNPMLGPSTYLLINMGARYVPCMHKLAGITSDPTVQFPCPNSTSVDTNVCNLAELCGLSGISQDSNGYHPDQWYRVITPIFLHAGFLHIGFNLLLQVTMGASVERAIGGLKYAIIYMASGISGFLLGANFSPNGIASTGASGALFGIIAANLLLFIYCGRKNTNPYGTKHYKLFIFIMIFEVIICFVLGLLPGLDNFSHIGGFCMGLLLSILFLPDPSFVYIDGVYTYYADTSTLQLMLNSWNPMDKYSDKIKWKVLAWAGFRVVCLVLAILYFALLFKNLYSKGMEEGKKTCTWCKYINCIPVNDWCKQGEVSVENVDSSGNTDSAASPTGNTDPASQSFSLMTITSPGQTVATEIPNTQKRGIAESYPTDTLQRDAANAFQRRFQVDISTTFNPETPLVGHDTSLQQPASILAYFTLVAVMAFQAFQFARRRSHKN
ncbi:hypothetical_protein [Candidozyma auris]|uniref:hypothetical_protein n=1 Tax=Candidozyma auris TaxID=498019 RepID=UPI000D28C08E|nr:hypothetical_protein [[Candida] auris]QEO21703.1 hypothetical_protein [[Candida] auris]GBL47798.1 putative rhomboid family protease GlpG [[Candida] auris]